ncbi:o-succinylbenzoate--CoA ligase [Pseudoneobacillus sp. C159]
MVGQIIPNLVKKRAHLSPNRVAIIFDNQEITFQELYDQAFAIAEKLTSHGVKAGQNIAVMLGNHIDTVYILFGLQLLGCRAVFINNRLTVNEIEWQLTDSQVELLITEKKFATIYTQLKGKLIDKEELQKIEGTAFFIQEEIDLRDICSIMYTSGTTGRPKGVLQTYGNHWWSATGSALNLGLHEDDRWLCTVPLFHISGYSILMRGIIYGMTVILHDGFNEVCVIREIVENRVTIISVVTTMVKRILEQLSTTTIPKEFRCMLVGGGPVPKPLLEECVKRNIPVYQTYGMTETSSQVVTLSPEDSLRKLGSAGKPLFPVQLKIVNEEGAEVNATESGEILVKAPNVTIGYLNRPDETSLKIQNDWFSTGDIGYVDQEGFLYVLDRRSDLIISGGENIYPAEIEGVLQSHKLVEDAGVIGVADDSWGQVPLALVVKKANAQIIEQELQSYCQERLAKFKIPKRFVFVEELPRNAAKKLMRHKLKKWWNEQTK